MGGSHFIMGKVISFLKTLKTSNPRPIKPKTLTVKPWSLEPWSLQNKNLFETLHSYSPRNPNFLKISRDPFKNLIKAFQKNPTPRNPALVPPSPIPHPHTPPPLTCTTAWWPYWWVAPSIPFGRFEPDQSLPTLTNHRCWSGGWSLGGEEEIMEGEGVGWGGVGRSEEGWWVGGGWGN